MTEAELTSALRQTLEKDDDAGRFAGAVLLAKHGKSAFAQAYGLSDREHKTLDTLKTRFRIGSMNKMFTAVALYSSRKPASSHSTIPSENTLTDYPNKDVATKVTIHELLTHTGGTGDIFGPEFDAHRPRAAYAGGSM
jgi:CubicO group peptidase (beta-lactamase class C family)